MKEKKIMKTFLIVWTYEYTTEDGVSRFKDGYSFFKGFNQEDAVETFVNDFDLGVLVKIITTDIMNTYKSPVDKLFLDNIKKRNKIKTME